MVVAALISAAALFYIYAGYQLTLILLTWCCRRREDETQFSTLPATTVLITAHNEAVGIAGRIDNTLALHDMPSQLQVLVASDGSTDGTNDIVQSYPDARVQLYRSPVNAGKTAAQNQAIAMATGDVIIFTDADSRFESDY
jgi:glycosyltransferase involved in cell wall biosynthesis